MRNYAANIPEKIELLQKKILQLRQEQKILLQNGDTGYSTAPSNIALIKYWGKQIGLRQIPCNSSLSFSLSSFRSMTTVTVCGRFLPEIPATRSDNNHHFSLKKGNKETQNELTPKMQRWLNDILTPYAHDITLNIASENNFPTACGIASSASGFAALTGAIADLLQLDVHFTPDELQYWLTQWSRLGSGSSTRSTLLDSSALFVSWNLNKETEEKNIKETTTCVEVHDFQWKKLRHCVFMLDESEKKISSSAGHEHAHSSPLHNIRVAQVEHQLAQLRYGLRNFDFELVKNMMEEDAFAMHAVMQTGNPPAHYLTPIISSILGQFIQRREKKKIAWTMDAGSNIHFLFMPEGENFLITYRDELELKLN